MNDTPRWLLPAAFLLLSPAAEARTLSVGPDQSLPGPAAAARAAQDGDTVLIEPGEYYDCAVWTQNHLVIAGAGSGVVITDSACQGKALFVITGAATTVRNLTLTRARVPDGNGAGIRQEGHGLILDHVRFINNQVGLLAGNAGAAAIQILDCTFENGGSGGERPTYAVRVGAISLLQIHRSTFNQNKGGQISSAAARTEILGNEISTGTGAQPGVAVFSATGHLLMRDNRLSMGPNLPKLPAAVLVAGQDTPELRGNRLLNTTGRSVELLRDWSDTEPVLEGNQVAPGDAVLSTSGLWRHRATVLYQGVQDRVRVFAGQVKRSLWALAGR